jgi:TPR repeat protein
VSYGHDLYDYGVDYIPPPLQLTPEEAAAAKAEAAKKNAGSDAAKMRFEEEQAENGKDLYQYRMGMRYLKGDGVPSDTLKAMDYFSKAVAQGNQDAKRELAKLAKRTPEPQTNASPAQPSAQSNGQFEAANPLTNSVHP